jgi:hypothetical protein
MREMSDQSGAGLHPRKWRAGLAAGRAGKDARQEEQRAAFALFQLCGIANAVKKAMIQL